MGTLVRHLERQHPQVIAVIASHLPPRQAADLVKRLTPKQQADVLRRVAELGLTDREILREVELALEFLLHDELRLLRNRRQGLATVSTILQAAGGEGAALLESITQHEHELAAELRPETLLDAGAAIGSRHEAVAPAGAVHRSSDSPDTGPSAIVPSAKGPPARTNPTVPTSSPARSSTTRLKSDQRASRRLDAAADLSLRPHRSSPAAEETGADGGLPFDDLVALDDDGWTRLLRELDPELMMLALTGASEPLLQRIQRGMSKREIQGLHERLRNTGPLKLSDIERAQRQIAQTASRLIAEGKIDPPGQRTFVAAA